MRMRLNIFLNHVANWRLFPLKAQIDYRDNMEKFVIFPFKKKLVPFIDWLACYIAFCRDMKAVLLNGIKY